jgi:hypothetical protein
MRDFEPHLEILPGSQRKLWRELAVIPREFVLYGGTALALHLGHRESVDFDLFSNRAIDSAKLEDELPFLRGARVVQRERNTLTALIERDGLVKVSFFGVPNLPRLMPVHVSDDNGLQVASLIDLAGTKAAVLPRRAEAKDYLDVDALLRVGNVDLPTALAAAQRLYGSSFNPETTLKALSYFDDGDLHTLPEDVRSRLVSAAREVDLEYLPEIGRGSSSPELDSGYEF